MRPQRRRPKPRPQARPATGAPSGPTVELTINAVGGEGDGMAAGPVFVPFTLPGADEPAEWTAILDTARVSREHRRLASGDQYLLESRSLALLRLRR